MATNENTRRVLIKKQRQQLAKRRAMGKRPNEDIREYAKIQGVYLWEIAEACGVSEATVYRKLRKELSPESKAQFYNLVDKISSY
jgi:DNA invertase Pin-like site-specific DNA recombinase